MILDDGDGMDIEDLYHALGMGTRRKYHEWHLGKYGMGMKQSTRSHAHEITILSKKKGGESDLAIMRDSTYWTLAHGLDQLMEETDIDNLEWMSQSMGYNLAKTMLLDRDHGTLFYLKVYIRDRKEVLTILAC